MLATATPSTIVAATVPLNSATGYPEASLPVNRPEPRPKAVTRPTTIGSKEPSPRRSSASRIGGVEALRKPTVIPWKARPANSHATPKGRYSAAINDTPARHREARPTR